jgi:hypothetical protein
MSTYEDAVLSDRFAALAPKPLAGDWEDVRARAGRRNGRRRLADVLWSRRRRPLVVLAAVILVGVLGAASALGVRAFILDKGFVGLPPEGATPSAPESGQLVVKLAGRSTTDEHLALVYLYADGRLIWARHDKLPEGANPSVTGLLEQRLTSQGVEQLRSEIVSSGLFDHDVALTSTRFIWGETDVRMAGRLVHVEWSRPDMVRADTQTASWVTATLEQERALERLDALLAHPTQGLAASAWADKRVRAYVPSTFAVCWEGWPAEPSDAQSDPTRILSLLPPAARQLLSGKATTRHTGKRGWAGGPYFPSARDCANVTTAEARSLAAILDDAGVERVDHAAGPQYSFDLPGPNRETALIPLESLLPDGGWTSFRTG